MAELFGVQRPAITKHLKNIFESSELQEEVVCSILERTTEHGAVAGLTQTQKVKYYNLDAVISVGYRVNSAQASQQVAMRVLTYRKPLYSLAVISASRSASWWAVSAFISSDKSPSMMWSSLYRVRLMRWSVIRPWGKL